MKSYSSFQFKYIKKIGIGSFGDVYLARSQSNKQYYTIKKASTSSSQNQLYNEAQFYKLLSETIGFPACYFYGNHSNNHLLVLEYLGKTLQELFEMCNKKFSLKTVLMIADQLLQRIEHLHSKGIVHRDIKPSNFLIGHGLKKHSIFLIDFGLSKKFVHFSSQANFPIINQTKPDCHFQSQSMFTISKYTLYNPAKYQVKKIEINPKFDKENRRLQSKYIEEEADIKQSFVGTYNHFKEFPKNNEQNSQLQRDEFKSEHSKSNILHIPLTFNNPVVGTLRFGSLNSNNGIEYSRRDDLESIGYMLIYFLKGCLPWESMKADSMNVLVSKIAKKKEEVSLEKLCSGIPGEFLSFMQSVRSLGFEDKPNYAEYRALFKNLFIKMNYIYDLEFDWCKNQKVKYDGNNFSDVKKDDETMKIYFSHSSTPVVMRKNAAVQLLKMQKKKVDIASRRTSGMTWLNIVSNIK